jgi:hypothetical protein
MRKTAEVQFGWAYVLPSPDSSLTFAGLDLQSKNAPPRVRTRRRVWLVGQNETVWVN